MAYDLGNIVTVTTTVTVNGVLTDPTAISLQVRNPDGSTTTYTPVHDSTGVYHADITPAAAGRYLYRWTSSGVATAADEGFFEVVDAWAAPSLVSLADVKTELNITGLAHDSELQGFIDAAKPVIEHITGPILAASVTEYHQGGGPYIVLRRVPVVAVTSITEYRPGSAVVLTAAANPSATVTDSYTVELDTGIVRRFMGSGVSYPFWPGTQAVQVVYTAGYTVVPPNVRMAALDLIEFWWQATRRGRVVTVGPDFDSGGDTLNILGFAVPYKVLGLLEPNQRIPGIA